MGMGVDEDRSSLETSADIRRARERLFAALLAWWEKPVSEEDEDSMDRGTVSETLRGLLRDAAKASEKETRRVAKMTKRSKVRA